MLKFVITRYIFYSFIALEIVIMPKLLSNELYGEFEYVKYLSSLLPLTLIGAHSGYMQKYYVNSIDSFNSLFVISIILLLFVGILSSVLLNNALYSISVLSIGLSFILEKKLLIENKYTHAILYKPLLSLLFVLITAIVSYIYSDFNSLFVMALSYILAITLILFFAIKNTVFKDIFETKLKNHLTIFISLVKHGFPLNLSTIIFAVFIFTDRFIINYYYNNDLPSYSLSFNFCQLVIVGLSSMNLITSTKIGENYRAHNKKSVKKILVKSITIFSILGFVCACILYTYNVYFTKFENILTYYFFSLSINGSFFIFGSVSSIIFYYGKQWRMSIIFLIIALLKILTLYILISFFNLTLYSILIKSIIFMNIFVAIGVYQLFKLLDE